MSGISPVNSNYSTDATQAPAPPPDASQETQQLEAETAAAAAQQQPEAATSTVFTSSVPAQVNASA